MEHSNPSTEVPSRGKDGGSFPVLAHRRFLFVAIFVGFSMLEVRAISP